MTDIQINKYKIVFKRKMSQLYNRRAGSFQLTYHYFYSIILVSQTLLLCKYDKGLSYS